MAFRASNQIQADALSEAKRRANDLKTYLLGVKAASAAAPDFSESPDEVCRCP